VIVSDNGSVDGSVEAIRERFPWVKVIENNANLGFGKANNIGAKQAKGEVLFFLNPDTLIVKGIEEMVEYVKVQKEVGVVGPVIYNGNNEVDDTTHLPIYTPFKLFLYYFFYRYQRRRRLLNIATHIRSLIPFEAETIMGACIMIRKTLFNSINGFDEKFFFGQEDMDMCLTIKKNGYTNKVFPLAEIIHFRGRSSGKSEDVILNMGSEKSLYFYKKNYPFSIFFVYLITIVFLSLHIFISFMKKIYYIISNNKTALSQRNKIIHQDWMTLKSYLNLKTIKYIL
jgi:GT2 family glycosyltransferase